jgi:predicted DNA-binding protein
MDKLARNADLFRAHDSPSLLPSNAAMRKLPSRQSTRVVREQPISIRFEPEMIERLDRVAIQLSKVNANLRIGRSSVVKLAVDRALMALESELRLSSPETARPLR